MQYFHKTITYTAIFSILTSCQLIEYHPYDCDIKGEKNLTTKNIQKIEDINFGDTIRFAVISDTQRWYDDTDEVVKVLNNRKDISFVLHCGDLSDFGTTKEFTWQRDILNRLKYPWIAIIGNHDMLGTGEFVYKEIFGDYNFAFTAGNTRFICLNTNALEYNDMEHIPNFDFIDNEYHNLSDEITKTVVAVHAPPTSEQFNNAVSNRFQESIKRFPGLQFVLCGHGHAFWEQDIFNDGKKYIMCPHIHSRTYLVFSIYNDQYSYEWFKF